MNLESNVGPPHVWRFFRAGGTDQVRFDRAEDLAAIGALDQKLWVALGCPVSGLEFDEKTLKLLDADGDGRIRAPEIVAVVEWIVSVLKNADVLMAGADGLPLSAIDDSKEEGKRLLALAREILRTNGKADAAVLSAADVADSEKFVAATKFNGDGVIIADCAEDAAVKGVFADVVDCLGAVPDRSGKPGIDQALVDRFFQDAAALSAWREKGAAHAASAPLGDKTADAHAACQAVRAKADDYFARCRTAAYDGRAAVLLNRAEADYAALAGKTLTATVPELADFPLARVEAGRSLPLDAGVNPAWAAEVARLRVDAVKPLLGDRTALSEAEWRDLQSRFAAQESWLAEKPATPVEKLSGARLKEILGGKGREALTALIAKDLELKPQFDSILSLERLVLCHRDLYRLLVNFVSFADFYGRKRKAVFQAGTLFIDGRSCELCVRVEDMGRHATLAALSQTYLLYCECVRRSTGEKMTIAAAVTGGDCDNLMVGRNGVFYDRKGRDWDATVVKIIEHPISIRQAFWSPYKKAIKLVEAQIHKFASDRDKASSDMAAAGVERAAKAAGGPSKPEPFDVGKFAGIFAAIGLAMGALGAAFGAVIAAFSHLAAWQMPLALGGVVLLVSGPSMLIAALKLRQRNLGPILDANGWAVNALVRINIPFGGALTRVATLPANAERTLDDPYAEKSRAPQWIAAAALLVALAAAWLAVRWYSALG